MSFEIPVTLLEQLQLQGDILRKDITNVFKEHGLSRHFFFSQIGRGCPHHLLHFARAVEVGPHATLLAKLHKEEGRTILFYQSVANPMKSDPYFVIVSGYGTVDSDLSCLFSEIYVPHLEALYSLFSIAWSLRSSDLRWQHYDSSDMQIGPPLFPARRSHH